MKGERGILEGYSTQFILLDWNNVKSELNVNRGGGRKEKKGN